MALKIANLSAPWKNEKAIIQYISMCVCVFHLPGNEYFNVNCTCNLTRQLIDHLSTWPYSTWLCHLVYTNLIGQTT